MPYAIDREEQAQQWSTSLIRLRAAREYCSLIEAQTLVASDYGIAPGTLENLMRGRSAAVKTWVYQRLQAAIISEYKREIAAHERELAKLERDARRDDRGAVEEVETSLARLQAVARRR